MREVYRLVCELWNRLHDELEGNLAVGACNGGQRFVTISEDACVAVFLTYPDDESNDYLLKVVLRCAVAV